MPAQRRLINFGIGATALCLLVGGAVLAGHDAPDSQAGKGAARGAPEPDRATAIGAYLDYGPKGVQRMEELSRWLGGTELRVGHSYLPGDLWENIEGRPGFLSSWAAWRKASEDRMFVLNTPMLERNEERVPDDEVRGLLRAGAEGQFDEHFRRLAERLVLLGVPDTVIVLGWEMNGTTYTHRCGPDPAAWKAYWKRIVTAMRSVSGQEFRFDFAPSRGRDAVPWTECYPGDDVVDIIGMDSYDQPPARTFDEQVNEPYGLRKQVDFAAEHGKPISFPEWGLFRNGDNPEYMRRMLEWMDQHKPVYQTITDYCPHGVWQCADNPESSAVFREMLSGLPDAGPSVPAPDPSGTPTAPKPGKPAPTEPAPDPNETGWCAAFPLSDWFGQWLTDHEFCLPG
ncbi:MULTISPECIES: glycoside hydrolase family 26 protein [Streptomyces]|uniref:glycoside hydrolase family 26 protein n=2 Tax=Streptomyces TaxID=1883 RepID=UPI0006B68485|nr:glycosyl hydrolase [Streptomyces sp. NRRL S-4]KPC81023.1 glycosyl hydrolase family 26 [Streptomyces sp. NRRL S-4]